jgi:hypothetical protein
MRMTPKDAYEQRFHAFSCKLALVRAMRPRTAYLYPLMDQVPFKDLEVALDIAIAAHHAKAAPTDPVAGD